MKRYEQYNIEDFVTDDFFIDWVLTPTKEHTQFWETWQEKFPNKLPLIKEAKELVLQLHEIETITSPQGHFQKNWKIIKEQTLAKEKQKIERPKARIAYSYNWLKYAAAVLIGIFATIGLFYFPSSPSRQISQQKKATPSVEWLELKNTTVVTQVIQLVDGSTVTLEPFSVLKYPTQFVKSQREVVLKGEAFFEIARDTTKPFVVYANETITKVLGTSFTIKAFEGEKAVEVSVKTGKVAVYAKVNSLPKKVIGEAEKFVIRTDEQILIPIPNKKLEVTPNQRVVFDKVKADMQKTVSKLPLLIKPLKQFPKFLFKEESLPEVLDALAKAYGLEIKYDATKLKGCFITTTLEDVSLFDKLDIICDAMNLSYQEEDASITIVGKGCE